MSDSVPKIIWLLWLQGWENAPEVVRACAASWVRLNPAWSVRFLTREHLPQLFPSSSPSARLLELDIPPEALSNVVRLELLARYGGVWADATTYCLMPLDEWLAPAVAEGFFAFDRPGPDRMLASWFLAAPPGAPVIARWRSLAQAYWTDRTERHTYFWFHYLFADAYKTHPDVKRVWDAMPKHAAAGPLAFAPYQNKLFRPLTAGAQKFVATAASPMLKLTHRINSDANDIKALFRRLCRINLGPRNGGTFYRWLCDRELGVPFGKPAIADWTGSL